MPSSFGQWYEDQKNASSTGGGTAPGGENADLEGGGMLPLFTSASASMESLNANVTGSLSNLKSGFESQFPSKVCGMNYQERFRMFCALLLVSALFFLLAFVVGLPLITVRPQKFAICFTFGSLTFMGSFAILKGPADHIRGMFSGDRLLFSAVYFTSMFSTLYFTLHTGGVKGYVTVLGCSAMQLVALVWYLISFIPGGGSGLRVLFAAMLKMIRPILLGCAKLWTSCIGTLLGWITR